MADITKKYILDKENDPKALEDLYRSDPVKFKASLLSDAPMSVVSPLLNFWNYFRKNELCIFESS